jgi:hypothetical protein
MVLGRVAGVVHNEQGVSDWNILGENVNLEKTSKRSKRNPRPSHVSGCFCVDGEVVGYSLHIIRCQNSFKERLSELRFPFLAPQITAPDPVTTSLPFLGGSTYCSCLHNNMAKLLSIGQRFDGQLGSFHTDAK